MRMLKKIAAGLLAAALAVGLLTACSDNKSYRNGEKLELEQYGQGIGKKSWPWVTDFTDFIDL